MNVDYKKGKDLRKEAPRSPKIILGGFAILARTIDKCRSSLWGTMGEYEFDCELDNYLFTFKGLTGEDFKKFVGEGYSDDEIAVWIKKQGNPRTNIEIAQWTKQQISNNYSDDAEGKEWLEAKNKKFGLSKDGTLFDYLEADDGASFEK